MSKIASVSKATVALISAKRETAVMIVVNAILWAAAILSVRLNEEKL